MGVNARRLTESIVLFFFFSEFFDGIDGSVVTSKNFHEKYGFIIFISIEVFRMDLGVYVYKSSPQSKQRTH